MTYKVKQAEKLRVSCQLLCGGCGFEFGREFDMETVLDDLRGCSCQNCGAPWSVLQARVGELTPLV